jgi:hypothetical protein
LRARTFKALSGAMNSSVERVEGPIVEKCWAFDRSAHRSARSFPASRAYDLELPRPLRFLGTGPRQFHSCRLGSFGDLAKTVIAAEARLAIDSGKDVTLDRVAAARTRRSSTHTSSSTSNRRAQTLRAGGRVLFEERAS